MTNVPPPPPPGGAVPPPSAPPAPMPGPGTPPPGPLGSRRSIGITILLAIVTLGIWTLIWSYKNGNELKEHTGDGLGGGVYLVLTIFISPVTMFLMAGEVEKLYVRQGRPAPITTLWGLWFLLPIIGQFVWYIRIQQSINDYWTSMGAVDDIGA